MNSVTLTSLFNLETVEKHLFRGHSWDLGFRALYGGQVLGQSVMAAYQTVAPEFTIHSFHSYFLLPGDAGIPVVYDIENVRDGRSFCTRRIKALQKGKTIFYMTASFQIAEDAPLQHQFANMPKVPLAEDTTPDIDNYLNNRSKVSERVKQAIEYHRPLDIRSVGGDNFSKALHKEPRRNIWFRSRDPMPEDLSVNQASLAYASDYHFLSTALFAHGLAPNDRSLRMATIDHAMWFHKPFAFDQWMLYKIHSPFSGNSRALVKGEIFDQQGTLVATSIQEGLLRKIA